MQNDNNMKTQADCHFPEIEWSKMEHIEVHDHERIYWAIGTSDDGRSWGADWHVIDGHHNEIDNIEELTP